MGVKNFTMGSINIAGGDFDSTDLPVWKKIALWLKQHRKAVAAVAFLALMTAVAPYLLTLFIPAAFFLSASFINMAALAVLLPLMLAGLGGFALSRIAENAFAKTILGGLGIALTFFSFAAFLVLMFSAPMGIPLVMPLIGLMAGVVTLGVGCLLEDACSRFLLERAYSRFFTEAISKVVAEQAQPAEARVAMSDASTAVPTQVNREPFPVLFDIRSSTFGTQTPARPAEPVDDNRHVPS
jgi:hypothetical protein